MPSPPHRPSLVPAFRPDRRRFLAGSAAGLAALALPALPRAYAAAPGDRLRIAVIGAMGKGKSDTANIAADHNVVALVDVDERSLADAAAILAGGGAKPKRAKGGAASDAADGAAPAPGDRPAPRLFSDFRRMFDEMANEIDAVIVSTPDHAHFPAALRAVREGKHVCVQKPLCNTIGEARALHKAAKEAGVITQMGNQGRTSEGHRVAKEWIEQGAIGTLQEVRLWTNRPIWPQGPLTKRPTAPPESLNWDLWLAALPQEPYFVFDVPEGVQDKRGGGIHPFNWRGWWAYGSGALGDMGCHVMDATFNVLGRRVPERIEAEHGEVTDLTAPTWSTFRYEFAASDRIPALTVTWHDGTRDGTPNRPNRDPRVPEAAFEKAKTGMIFIGTDGVLFDGTGYCFEPTLYPEERAADVKKAVEAGTIRQTEPRSTHPQNPQLEWAEAIVRGGTTSSNFDYAAPLTEFVLLGNLAIRSGEPIAWDAALGRVTNSEPANRFVNRPAYREGWV